MAAVIGTVAGIPLGVGAGRWLWTLFVHSIYAVPEPRVPTLTVIRVAVGVFLFSNIVGARPGHLAARIPTALVLRTE